MLLQRDGMMRQFKENLSVAQRRIETTANPKCRVVAFLLGDRVFIQTTTISENYYGESAFEQVFKELLQSICHHRTHRKGFVSPRFTGY